MAGSPGLEVLRRLRPVPVRSVNGEPTPPIRAGSPDWRVRTGTVPTFTAVRSTGEEPHFVPAASPWLRRGHSPWPPGERIHTRPGVGPTSKEAPVVCAPLPAQIRQIEAGRYLRDVITRVPLVLLPITLAGPAPSGSSGPSRLCQGCSHPPRHLPGQAALSFTSLPRQGQRCRSLTSTQTTAPRGARTPPGGGGGETVAQVIVAETGADMYGSRPPPIWLCLGRASAGDV